jgi:Amidohydrolase/Starch/carbohydrate-binding module (family 53)
MKQAAAEGVVGWWRDTADGHYVAYRGALGGGDLKLHYGFDGWSGPTYYSRLESVAEGLAVAQVPELDGHLALDFAVTDGERWDNNAGLDYRLWIGFDALDAHMHLSGRGPGALGVRSFVIAMASAGMVCGISSWLDNRALDRVDRDAARIFPLIWTRPGSIELDEVGARLRAGAVGLKLHPTVDGYPADDRALDRYVAVAEDAGCPVACHSAPGEADPDHIRRLAERFPTVPIIMYHTYLGPDEGRRRAAAHVLEQPNLYLETSWCRSDIVMRLVREVGPDHVLFGSDASIDGPAHYCRHPPNVEGRETYNDGLLALVGELGPRAARAVMGDNARRLFRLNGKSHG